MSEHGITYVAGDGRAWDCRCGVNGFDIYDLASHANIAWHGCPECGEPLTVEGSGDGTGDPQHVFCDVCGKAEHPADLTPDWNGETGNHLSCEAGSDFYPHGTDLSVYLADEGMTLEDFANS